MKKKSLLVNVGRGITLNEKELIQYLKKENHFYASLDVFQNEPLPKSSKLWNHPNVTITPHVASITIVKSESVSKDCLLGDSQIIFQMSISDCPNSQNLTFSLK